jgi:hypothetical protein
LQKGALKAVRITGKTRKVTKNGSHLLTKSVLKLDFEFLDFGFAVALSRRKLFRSVYNLENQCK